MTAQELEAKRLFFSNLAFYLWNGMDRCPFVVSKPPNCATDYIGILNEMYKSAELVVAKQRWWMRWFIVPTYHFCLRVWR